MRLHQYTNNEKNLHVITGRQGIEKILNILATRKFKFTLKAEAGTFIGAEIAVAEGSDNGGYRLRFNNSVSRILFFTSRHVKSIAVRDLGKPSMSMQLNTTTDESRLTLTSFKSSTKRDNIVLDNTIADEDQ